MIGGRTRESGKIKMPVLRDDLLHSQASCAIGRLNLIVVGHRNFGEERKVPHDQLPRERRRL